MLRTGLVSIGRRRVLNETLFVPEHKFCGPVVLCVPIVRSAAQGWLRAPGFRGDMLQLYVEKAGPWREVAEM